MDLDFDESSQFDDDDLGLPSGTKENTGRFAMFPPCHLNVPLRGEIYELYRQYEIDRTFPLRTPKYKQLKVQTMSDQYHNYITQGIINPLGSPQNLILEPAHIQGTIFSFALSDNQWSSGVIESEILKEFNLAYGIAWRLFLDEATACRISTINYEQISLEKLTQLLNNDEKLKKLLYLSTFFRSLTLSMNAVSSSASPPSTLPYIHVVKENLVTLLSKNNIFAATMGEGCTLKIDEKVCILSKDLTIAISDVCHQRMNVYLSSKLGTIFNLRQYIPINTLLPILDWGDEILLQYGQTGFTLIKQLESIVTASLIESKEEAVCDNKKFWKGIVREYEEQGELVKLERINYIREIIDTCSLDVKSQIFGLFRIWGHPVVDTVAGILKVKQSALRITKSDHRLAKEVLYMFRYLFINGFIKKHHRWPECTLSPLAPKHIIEMRRHHRPLIIGHPEFDIQHMKHVNLDKNFEPDKTFNISQMISDKALSLTRSKLKDKVTQKKGYGKSEERRVILEWLNSSLESSNEIIEEIDRDGFSYDDLVIGVVPKEREMKDKPRLFALLTLKARLYFVITESLLSDHIIDYFPQITMTASGSELSKILYSMSKNQRTKGENLSVVEFITMNIDFEKWNLMMRKWFSLPLFQELDRLFGFNKLYALTHDFFFNSVCYLADDETKLEMGQDGELKPNPYCWYNHLGGFEGQRQKGWTILTACLIELCAIKHGLAHKLIGQGDNQVLMIQIKIPYKVGSGSKELNYDLAKKRFESFKNTFFDYCTRAGLPVKESETWESSVLFAYGKQLIFQGNPLCMSQKRLSRQFPLANEDFPSLVNEMSTIFGSGNAATQTDICPTLPFLMTLLNAGLTILNNFKFSILCNNSLSKIFKLSSTQEWRSDLPRDVYRFVVEISLKIPENMASLIKFLLIFPRILGGLPIQYMSTFCLRGFPDPLSEALAMVKKLHLITSDPEIKSMTNYLMSIKTRVQVKPLMLLQDPVSININCPTSNVGIIKNEALSHLKKMNPKNPHLNMAISNHNEQYEEIAKKLYLLNPYHAYLMSDILEASIPGYIHSTVSKITKTTTILDQTTKKSGLSLLNKLMRSELNQFAHLIWSYQEVRRVTGLYIPSCTTELAAKLRNTGWDHKTILGVTVPHPLEIFESIPVSPGNPCSKCEGEPLSDHLRINIDPSLQKDPARVFSFLGPNTPYIGSETVEKNTKLIGGSMVNIDSLLKRAVSLARTIGWFINLGDPAQDLIFNLIGSISDIDPHLFISFSEATSGSAFHRYQGVHTIRAGLISTLYRYASYLQLSTNTLYTYGKGKLNTNLHFQSMMVFNQQTLCSTLANLPGLTHLPYSSCHYHIDCPRCITAIEGDKLVGTDSWRQVMFPKLSTPYTWIPQQQVVEKMKTHSIAQGFQNISLEQCTVEQIQCLFYYRVAKEIARRVNISSRSTDFNIDLGITVVHLVRSNPVKILEYSLTVFFIDWCAYNMKTFRIGEKLEGIISQFTSYLFSLHPSSLSCLTPIFADEYDRVLLSYSIYKIRSPISAPITMNSGGAAIKNAWISIIQQDGLILEEIAQNLLFCAEDFHLISDMRTHLTANWLLNGCPYNHINYISQMIDCYRRCTESQIPYWTPSQVIDFVYNKNLSVPNIKFIKENSQRIPILVFAPLDVLSKCVGKEAHYKQDFLPPDIEVMSRCLDEIWTNSQPLSSQFKIISRNGFELIPHKETKIEEQKIEYLSNINFDNLFFRVPSLDTSAWMKVASFLKYLEIQDPSVIACCGDGTGGISAFMLRNFPRAKIYFNTLLSLENVLPHSLPNYIPSSFDYILDAKERIINLEDFSDQVTDITHPSFPCEVWESVSKHGKLDLIVCDAEGVGWEDINFSILLVRNLLITALGNVGQGSIIFKTYVINLEILIICISLCKHFYHSVTLIRSHFSSQDNTEIYIVCKKRISQVFDFSSLNIKFEQGTIKGMFKSNQALQFMTREVSTWFHSCSNQLSMDSVVPYQKMGLLLFFENDINIPLKSGFPGESYNLLQTLAKDGLSTEVQHLLRKWWLYSMKPFTPLYLMKTLPNSSQSLVIGTNSVSYLSAVFIALLSVLLPDSRTRLQFIKRAINHSYLYWIQLDRAVLPLLFVGYDPQPKHPTSSDRPIRQEKHFFKLKLFSRNNTIIKMLYKLSGLVDLYTRLNPLNITFNFETITSDIKSSYINTYQPITPNPKLPDQDLRLSIINYRLYSIDQWMGRKYPSPVFLRLAYPKDVHKKANELRAQGKDIHNPEINPYRLYYTTLKEKYGDKLFIIEYEQIYKTKYVKSAEITDNTELYLDLFATVEGITEEDIEWDSSDPENIYCMETPPQ